MISKLALQERVQEWSLREDVVEKDYLLGWVLWAIGTDEALRDTWVFKGGTCLKKCYLETYRFSEDLDFTILPGGPYREAELRPILTALLARLEAESGISFSARAPVLKTHPSGNYTEGRIYYQGPRGAPTPASIRLDLSASEVLARPTELRAVIHPYPDELPPPATVRCYSFHELFAEKLRAMGERGRPRDLYDIVNLFRRPDLQASATVIRDTLAAKCESKGVPVPTFALVNAAPSRVELESEWANMLAHQLPALPPFLDFWNELKTLFSWLEGRAEALLVEPIPFSADEEPAWVPPSMPSIWRQPVSMESLRFAGSNYLCVELGYNGTRRVVEPYSLRRTRAGNLLLHALRVDSREHRAYRVDRIQSLRITDRAFRPVYRVEFSTSAPLFAPSAAVTAPRAAGRARPSSLARRATGTTYVIECPFCQKRFNRSRLDTRLNSHKDAFRTACPGRSGYLVDTRYR